jgi:hypothetical protein
MPTDATARRSGGRWWHVGVATVATVALGALASCSALRTDSIDESKVETASAVAAASGWTRAVVSEHYLVIVNVLPGESMFTDDEKMSMHPTEGELILNGKGNQTGEHVRHVEAHVYDRATGAVITDVTPTITVTNRTSGDIIEVAPTLMQDINIGEIDRHYGNNVMIMPDSDLQVRVSVGREEVSVDGHLD